MQYVICVRSTHCPDVWWVQNEPLWCDQEVRTRCFGHLMITRVECLTFVKLLSYR